MVLGMGLKGEEVSDNRTPRLSCESSLSAMQATVEALRRGRPRAARRGCDDSESYIPFEVYREQGAIRKDGSGKTFMSVG